MANTFNSSLLCLQKQDIVEIERDTVRELSLSRVRNIQEISILAHQVQNALCFLQKARKYLSFRKDGKPRVVCSTQSIIDKKKLQSFLILETRFAKITLDESMYTIQEFGAKLLEYHKKHYMDKMIKLYKPCVESSQWVSNKVR